MADVLTPEQRRRNMSRIRGRDTKPELAVRRLVLDLGFRYRLHDKTLPGRPDLVFRGRRKVIFVHGCFWHRHECAHGQVRPGTRADFWMRKLERNVQRDQENLPALELAGWRPLVVWECELAEPEILAQRIEKFLRAT